MQFTKAAEHNKVPVTVDEGCESWIALTVLFNCSSFSIKWDDSLK